MKKRTFFFTAFVLLLLFAIVFPIAATIPEEDAEQRFYDNLLLNFGNIMGGIVIGGFCGGAPVCVGMIRKRFLLAVIAIISCVAFGVVCTLVLNIPAFTTALLAGGFVFLMFIPKRKKSQN